MLVRDDNYALLLRLYREFLLSSPLSWPEMDRLQETRDVATLYEMWVYVTTAVSLAEIAESVSMPSPRSLIRLHERGLEVTLAAGRQSDINFWIAGTSVTLSYNRTFPTRDLHRDRNGFPRHIRCP